MSGTMILNPQGGWGRRWLVELIAEETGGASGVTSRTTENNHRKSAVGMTDATSESLRGAIRTEGTES